VDGRVLGQGGKEQEMDGRVLVHKDHEAKQQENEHELRVFHNPHTHGQTEEQREADWRQRHERRHGACE